MRISNLLLRSLQTPFVLVFSAINFRLGLYALGQIEMFMVLTLAGLYWWSKRKHPRFLLKNLFFLHPAVLFSILFLQLNRFLYGDFKGKERAG